MTLPSIRIAIAGLGEIGKTIARKLAQGLPGLALAAGPGRVLAAIGPHIETCCFEVGDDVAAELAAASTQGAAVIERRAGARPHVDLRRVVRAQLVAAGVGDADIDDVAGCTVCDAARFFSYRRDGARSGRLLSAIVARGAVGAGGAGDSTAAG